MHTYTSLYDQFARLPIDPRGTLLVHSSMKAIGPCEGGGDTVLDVLMEYMREGLLVLPTHTWSDENNRNGIFDPQTETACVGILPNLFMKRQGVLRSLHPTHSLAAYGKDAAVFVSGEENVSTPCAREGCYGKLYDRNSQVLFLGCSLKSNTILHGVEEWNDIPDRLTPSKQAFTIRLPGGQFLQHAVYRHYSSAGNVSLNYDKLEAPLLASGIAITGYVGDALCYLANARAMCDLAAAFLQKDPALFSNADPVPASWYA